MKKIIKLTESDLLRLVRKIISENVIPQVDISVPELIGKTVTFDFICGRKSFGDIQVKITDAKYITIDGDDDTMKTIKLKAKLLETTTTFDILVLKKEGTITYNFAMIGPYDKEIKFCDSPLKRLVNDNFFRYIISLKKYPIVRTQKIKSKTDF